MAYTDAAKREVLGVPADLLARYGAVSAQVAAAMAVGALAASSGDVALSVTGFAGPGAPGEEPGLVHFGMARAGFETITREHHFGDIGRGAVRLACLEVGLKLLHSGLTC